MIKVLGTLWAVKLRVLVFRTSVTVVLRISSPCKGEVPSFSEAERVLLEIQSMKIGERT